MTYRCLFAVIALAGICVQPATAQTSNPPFIKEHFGITSVLTIPIDTMKAVKLIRTYTSAGTFCREPEGYMYEPTWQNFHYDHQLEEAKAKGVKYVVCITNNMPYYTTTNTTENEDHPVPTGANKEDPASYVMYARLLFQITARYGSKTVPDSLLKVKSYPSTDYRHQTKRSGTDMLYGIELWNEANKWGGNFTPKEYYAMLSACYDGHKGTLGPDAGVMNADPDMNFIFTGTSDHTPTYHQQVRDIWVQERGEPFPEKIIYNFHGYFHDKVINNGTRTTGITPELGDALTLYRAWQTFAGNNRVAKTEYGYDTHASSIQRAPLLHKPGAGNYNIHESQAALILRDYHFQTVIPNFFLSTFYNVRDGNGGGSSLQYTTSGLTRGSCCQYAKKEGYYLIKGFTELAGDYYSNGTLIREDPYVVEYKNEQGNYLYAVWAYSQDSFMINNVITADDTVEVIIPSKTGNVFSNILPSNAKFSVQAQQMPTYLKTGTRSIFGLAITGIIKTETNVPVPDVKVYLSGAGIDSMVTNKTGVYAFAIDTGGDYTVTPSKTTEIPTTNGISTLDLTLIKKHLLQNPLFSSPYKIIASDANNSETVTTVDITIIRSVILGKPSFPGGRLWEFVNSDKVFAGPPYNPFPFPRTRQFWNVAQTQSNKNFIAVKLGDVNNSWHAP